MASRVQSGRPQMKNNHNPLLEQPTRQLDQERPPPSTQTIRQPLVRISRPLLRPMDISDPHNPWGVGRHRVWGLGGGVDRFMRQRQRQKWPKRSMEHLKQPCAPVLLTRLSSLRTPLALPRPKVPGSLWPPPRVMLGRPPQRTLRVTLSKVLWPPPKGARAKPPKIPLRRKCKGSSPPPRGCWTESPNPPSG